MLSPPSRPRSPWQKFYGAVHRWRSGYWLKRRHSLPVPVISIGNLHWGGTGKTPLTAAVAVHLRDSGRQVAILSRGYGSQGKGIRIVSRGQGPLLDATMAGDEPVLLADRLPGVAVVVCPDRYAAGVHALEHLDPRPEIFLLDDGFSHLKLDRSLDLLIFPASDPFAGGRLFPGGKLREPLASSKRADAVLLSGSDDPACGLLLAKCLRPHGFDGPGFASSTRLSAPTSTVQGNLLPDDSRFLAVSAIARPQVFVDGARRLDLQIVDRVDFPDHHAYGSASLDTIRERFKASQVDALLITDKDRVKLADRIDLPMAVLQLTAEPEDAFFDWLDDRLAELL